MARVSSQSARATFRWRYLVRLLQDLRLDELQELAAKRLRSQRELGSTGWLIVTFGAFSLLYWNGKLFLATGAGVAVMLLVYVLHDWKPEVDWSELRQFLQGWNQPFVVSVGAGAIATLTTYLAAAVWTDSTSPWIASAAILQGAGTLAVLVLLVLQIIHRRTHRDRTQYTQLLADLTHKDPLKRLIAVRQLTEFVSVLEDHSIVQRGRAKQPSRREIADYFRVMLSREPNATVRGAVLDGLQTLDIVHQLQAATEPIVSLPSRQPMPAKLGTPIATQIRTPRKLSHSMAETDSAIARP